MDIILEARGISLSFGGVKALNDVSFYVQKDEIFGIIGPNGSGKTSLFNVITGIYKPDKGEVIFSPDGNQKINITKFPSWKIARLGIARTFQNIKLFGYISVQENILLGRNFHFRSGTLGVIFGRYSKDYEQNIDFVEELIDFLDLKAYRRAIARDIPLGIRKKVELARAVAQRPKLLLLDEPTAGLTYEEKSEFLYYIREINQKFGITIVIIEHDVKVISSVASQIMALDFGLKIAEGKPEDVLKNPKVISAYLGAE